MLHHNDAMWRIEFRSDLTRADALSLPLAYVLEAHWDSGDRWLGMLFRKRLTTLELEHVDIATWSEMKNLEAFMKGLFDEAWNTLQIKIDEGEEQATLPLGSAIIAAKYPVQSALHFAPTQGKVIVGDDDPVKSFQTLYAYLLGLRDNLSSALVAPVVQLPARKRAIPFVAQHDVEIANRAA
jgi:hypothetical protein